MSEHVFAVFVLLLVTNAYALVKVLTAPAILLASIEVKPYAAGVAVIRLEKFVAQLLRSASLDGI